MPAKRQAKSTRARSPGTARRELPPQAAVGKPRSFTAGNLEIRTHANGSLDEVVARDATVHLEQMDANFWSLVIEDAQGRRALVHLTTSRDAIRGQATFEGIAGDAPDYFATRAPQPNKPFSHLKSHE